MTKNKEIAAAFGKFHEGLSKESDRGAVIVGAAILDDMLVEIMKARLVLTESGRDELFDGANAPCSSFAAKVDLAYRIGAIRLSVKRTLHIIRRMRNEFAHVSSPADFSSRAVQDQLREIFKLSHDGFEGFWAEVAVPGSHVRDAVRDPHAGDAIDRFVEAIGWRNLFDIFVAMNASFMSRVPTVVERLVSIDESDPD